jgi:hypothetical protein
VKGQQGLALPLEKALSTGEVTLQCPSPVASIPRAPLVGILVQWSAHPHVFLLSEFFSWEAPGFAP